MTEVTLSLRGVDRYEECACRRPRCTARKAALSNPDTSINDVYMYAFFAQDDWRGDFGSLAYEANNRLVNFDSVAAAGAINNTQAIASLRLASDGPGRHSSQETSILLEDRLLEIAS